mgnify:CR=1 FL=1
MTKFVRAVFPMLIVLRLADQKDPVMDKLYFYVRRMDKTLAKSKEILDELTEKTQGQSWQFLNSMTEDGSLIDDESSTNDSEPEATILSSGTDDSDNEAVTSLGQKVIDIWTKRRKKLVSDYAISGWLLSPIPEVFEDARINMTGDHRDAMERLVQKTMGSRFADDSDELAGIMNKFWSEFEHFRTKTGHFAKAYIWNPKNPDLLLGRSHLWHRTNSYFHTEILGKFACRVCSKIVGMGSAERNWGDVKHLKTEKRSHLSTESVQKQATIFGASCMADAALERLKAQSNTTEPYKFWDEDDFDAQFDMFAVQPPAKKPPRILKCYFEDWEEEHVRKKDDVSEAKFLQKYGGLEFKDIDNGRLLKISAAEMYYTKKKWCVAALTEDGNEEPWLIEEGCPLHDCLALYYKKRPDKNVKIVLRKNQISDIALLSDALPSDGLPEKSTTKKLPEKSTTKKSPKKRKSNSSGTNDKDPPTTDPKRSRASTSDSLSPCGGCGQPVSPVHKCDLCYRSMHPFCGRTIGEEGHGSSVRCKECDGLPSSL